MQKHRNYRELKALLYIVVNCTLLLYCVKITSLFNNKMKEMSRSINKK